MYFQTVIMNSEFATQAVSDDLRFIDWSYRHNNSPANLDETDFDKLITSDKLFARKFEYPVSEVVLDKILHRTGRSNAEEGSRMNQI